MSSFEYVMVLVSIILGLGITTLLSGAVRVLQAGSGMKMGLLHSLWVMQLLVAQVNLWASRWTGEGRGVWSGTVLFLFLLMPIIYYALADLLFPEAGDTVELTDYFLDNRRAFFGLLVLASIGGAIGPSIFYQTDRTPAVVLLGLIPGHVFFAFSRNRRLHVAWAGFVLFVYAVGLAGMSIG
jgi:hypothetical protein